MATQQRPSWAYAKTAAVRLGGPAGRVCGFLWQDDSGRASFAYCADYVLDTDAVPLDPVRLPFRWAPYSSPSMMQGPLAVFGRCLPGKISGDIVQALLHLRFTGSAPKKGKEIAPATELTRLVWSCVTGTLPSGVNGMWFDPSVPFTQFMRDVSLDPLPRQDVGDIEFWGRIKESIPRTFPLPSAKVFQACQQVSTGAAVDELWLPLLAAVLPLPGSGLRMRFDTNGRTGMIRFAEKTEAVRDLRVRAAYLDLARESGIRSIQTQLFSHNDRDFMWTPLLKNSLLWSVGRDPYRNPGMTEDEAAEQWLRETMKKGVYLGRGPHQSYARLALKFRDEDHFEYDHREAYRRLCFSILTGTLPMDSSPLLFSLSRAYPSWEGNFARAPLKLHLPSWHAIKPWKLPYKTALSIKPRLILQAAHYSRYFAISSAAAQEDLTKVLLGITRWEAVFARSNLNDFEANGIRPAIMVPAAESGQAAMMKVEVRPPKFKVVRTPG